MKYEVHETTKFKRDRRLCVRRGLPQEELDAVVLALAEGEALPPKFRDHALSGEWAGYRDCHIRPDWLLVYRVFEDRLELLLSRTGSHSDVLRT